jgi:hypothetical protein
MSHLPINHPLRPLWRTLTALAGLYILIFGIVGLAQGGSDGFFGNDDTFALGLRTNPAFSVLSIVVGSVVLLGSVYGRNVDRFIDFGGGIVFMVAGLVMLALLRSSANFLNFQVSTVVVSFIIGSLLLTGGLYGKVGSAEDVAAEEQYRHGDAPVGAH